MTPNMITTNGTRGLMGGFPGAKRKGGTDLGLELLGTGDCY